MNKGARELLDSIGSNPYFFNFLQKVCNLGDLKEEVSLRLKAEPGESILDVGCGTGLYSVLAKGRYVGLDLNGSYIKYARTKYKSGNKKFIVEDVTRLSLGEEMFDKTLYIAMLHHFDEADNIKILNRISSVTKKMVLILDAALPDNPTAAQKFFLKVERGQYVRPLNEQISIVRKVFDIKNVSLVFNRSKFGLFSIIEAYPKGAV